MNFGLSGTFFMLYLIHMEYFPIVFNTTTMGICNVVARTCTVFAPIIAEVSQPTPAIIFSVLMIAAIVTSAFIRRKTASFY